jgi:hypothetical protein
MNQSCRGIAPLLMVLWSGCASAKSCTPAEWEADRWAQTVCTSLKESSTPSQGSGRNAARAVPRKSEVGADRWIARYTESVRLIVASVETTDTAEWRRQRGELSKLVGDASAWPDHDAWRDVRSQCVNAAQNLLSFMDVAIKSDARSRVAAEDRLKAALETTTRCEAGLKRQR